MKVSDVNTTDIKDAIRLGCRVMCRCFNADDNNVPYFRAIIHPNPFLGISMESHVPGRHLNALLNAENATDITLCESCIQNHEKATFFSYSGSVPLPLGRVNTDNFSARSIEEVPIVKSPKRYFGPHDTREGFHALYSLVKYRNSSKAEKLAEASINAIFQYWNPTTEWDYDRLEREHKLSFQKPRSFVNGLARTIGPLVKYYRVTNYGPALELALLLKQKTVNEAFTNDGSFDEKVFGYHIHSTTSVMSSLAQLADLMKDSLLMNRVKTFYDNGLWKMRDQLGWSIESTNPANINSDEGEMNNTGDILETALILGRWGHTVYYHDAERILRCHLLPSQLRDVSFIKEPPNPQNVDGLKNVADRLRGAFGFPAPYGHKPLENERIRFNLDVVGGTVGSLCEAYREISRSDQVGHWVNMLFDHESPSVKIESPYTHSSLRVTTKQPGPLFIRIPPWVKPHEIKIQGVTGNTSIENDYLFIPQPVINRPISLTFPLLEQELTLNHRTRQIKTRLLGDSIIQMDNFGADLTFFDPL